MDKAIIYNRTSSIDQHPELQLKECEEYIKEKGWECIDRLEEQKSAFKDESKRIKFNAMIDRAKNNEFTHIVVWNMDRFSRQPEEDVLKLTKMLSLIYNVQVHAVHGDVWSEMIESMGNLKTMGFIGTAISEFLEKLINGLEFQRAHRESQVKSERVKLSIRKDGGVTKSYKGNKWGRRALKIDDKIIEEHNKGSNMRQITESVYYWDKNKHKKFVSLGYVHKVIQENNDVHKLLSENDKKHTQNKSQLASEIN